MGLLSGPPESHALAAEPRSLAQRWVLHLRSRKRLGMFEN
jgi:hypothetical protein